MYSTQDPPQEVEAPAAGGEPAVGTAASTEEGASAATPSASAGVNAHGEESTVEGGGVGGGGVAGGLVGERQQEQAQPAVGAHSQAVRVPVLLWGGLLSQAGDMVGMRRGDSFPRRLTPSLHPTPFE